MKYKFIFFIFIFCSFIQFNALKAQNIPLNDYLKKVDEVTSTNAQEKVYLHLDKPYYAIGDDIWLKAYVINAKNGHPSLTSNFLYVELINEKDSVVNQLKLQMLGGITWGDFKLTDAYSDGNYRIRAYTQWMRNAGTDFFYDKVIQIGNSWANKVFVSADHRFSTTENKQQKIQTTLKFTDKQKIPYANSPVTFEVKLKDKNIERGKGITNPNGEIFIEATNKQPEVYKNGYIIANITLPNKQIIRKEVAINTNVNAIDLRFFPEGGKLVEGLPNKIGVKSINGNGRGEIAKGKIINNDGIEISSFETNNLGMTSFFLSPQPNQTYKANVEFNNGTKQTIDIPLAEKSGVVLNVNNIDSAKMTLRLFFTEDLINKANYNLIAQHNGAIYFSTKINPNRQALALSVAKDSLPSGIITISLLNENYQPLIERLAFINNYADKITVESSNLKEKYDTKAKVDFNLKAMNDGAPVQGSFSIAVTNTAAVKPDVENESNILTRLLLTSDLVGYVEKPNHYFLNKDKTTIQDLDNLLLTQGWRKIDWVAIAEDKTPKPSFLPEKKIQISGTITKGGKPVVKGKVTLVSFTKGFFIIDTVTNDKGHFNFDQLEFLDSTRFVVQARTEKDRKFVDIKMDDYPGQIVTSNPNTGDIEINVNQSLSGYLSESNKYFDGQTQKGFLNRTIVLDEVKITEKRKATYESSNIGGAGNADAVFHAKDLETTFSLGQFLQGRIAGVQIRDGQAYARGNTSPMKISVDGMMLEGDDINLETVVVADIETVEILKSISTTAIYGMNGGSGVIVITTKKGGGLRTGNPYTPGLIPYNPKGLSIVRQFYSPKYNTTADNSTDYRTTVYWNPQVITDKDGNTNINFYNTSVPGIYRIVFEGIDANGNLARKVMSYQVN